MYPQTLSEWLAKIEALRPDVIRLGLERMQEVAGRLGIVTLPGKIITVAGTNGKGSTVALLDALVSRCGLTTSVYTSPHLFHFNERIRHHGRLASDDDLCRAFTEVERARGDVPLTYFEFTTLAAFWLFHESPTAIYLLEVGLGGRLDAVNLLDADVAVITSIGLDHTEWLGTTRDAIGREKAGIARAGRLLLYGERDMPASIAICANEKGARLLRAGEAFGFDAVQKKLFWADHQMMLEQPVWLGEDNLATALAALACLDIWPNDTIIRDVAATTRLPGRCELYHLDGCDWLFDVGHNREAVARVASRLPAHGGRTLALCGMLADKPADAVLALRDKVDRWFVTDLPGPRGGGVARFDSLLPDARKFNRPEEALAALRAELEPGDRVLVFGSFVTVMIVQSCLGLMKEMN